MGKFLAWPPENMQINFFLKNYEGKTDSKLNSYIDAWWFLNTTKKINPNK